MSNNYDVAESYGLGIRKEVLRSNYGLTERNEGVDKIKGVEEIKHAKSKSLLSKQMSSKNDKNSIDFDDIQPINYVGDQPFVRIGAKNSRQGFYDVESQQISPANKSNNIIEMFSGISIKDSIESRSEVNEELKQQKNIKTYAGKKGKSR